MWSARYGAHHPSATTWPCRTTMSECSSKPAASTESKKSSTPPASTPWADGAERGSERTVTRQRVLRPALEGDVRGLGPEKSARQPVPVLIAP